MKKTRMSLSERKGVGLKQNQQSTQRKQTPTNPTVMRKNNSVNININQKQSGQKTEEKQTHQKSMPVMEIDLETPEQSLGADK